MSSRLRIASSFVVALAAWSATGCETDDVVARPFDTRLEQRLSDFCRRICSQLRACEPAMLAADCEKDCQGALGSLAERGDECAALGDAVMACYPALGCEAFVDGGNACGFDAELWALCQGASSIDAGWIHRAPAAAICQSGDGHSASAGDTSEEPWVYCDVDGSDCTDGRTHRVTCTQDGPLRYCTCYVDGAESRVIDAPADGGCGNVAKVDFGCGWILP